MKILTPPLAPAPAAPVLALAPISTREALRTVLDAHGFHLSGRTICIRGESATQYLTSAHHSPPRRDWPECCSPWVDTGALRGGPFGPVVVLVRQSYQRTRTHRHRGRPSRAGQLAEATASIDRLLAALAHARIPTLVDHQPGVALQHRVPAVPANLDDYHSGFGQPWNDRLRPGAALGGWLAGGQLDAADPVLPVDLKELSRQRSALADEPQLIHYQAQLTEAERHELAYLGAHVDPVAGDLRWEDLRTLPADRLALVREFVKAHSKNKPDSWQRW